MPGKYEIVLIFTWFLLKCLKLASQIKQLFHLVSGDSTDNLTIWRQRLL